jgi:hypothetical protein
MTSRKAPQPDRDIVKLTDLAPRQTVTGGSERRVFGADGLIPGVFAGQEHTMAGTKTKPKKDLTPKGTVKGGGGVPGRAIS